MRTATSIPRMYADERGLKCRHLPETCIGNFFSIHLGLGDGREDPPDGRESAGKKSCGGSR